jgi:hypothetical protein
MPASNLPDLSGLDFDQLRSRSDAVLVAGDFRFSIPNCGIEWSPFPPRKREVPFAVVTTDHRRWKHAISCQLIKFEGPETNGIIARHQSGTPRLLNYVVDFI